MNKALLCFLLLPGVGFTSDNHEIVPGARIGEIHLGFPREQARGILGQPKSTTSDGDAFENLSVKYDGRDTVIQISTSDKAFATSSGISAASQETEFARTYFVRFKLCADEKGVPERKTLAILDAIDRGIALEITAPKDAPASATNTIVVHRPGIALTTNDKLHVCE